MPARMSEPVMPENDVSCITVEIDIGLLIEVLCVVVIPVVSFGCVAALECVIEAAMTTRPDFESAAVRVDVINITDNAQVKRVALAVAGWSLERFFSFGEGSIDATESIRRAQSALSEELFGHRPNYGI